MKRRAAVSLMVIFLQDGEEKSRVNCCNKTMVVLLPPSLQRASLVALSRVWLALLEEVAKRSNICSCSKMLDKNDSSTISVTYVTQTTSCLQRAFY